MLPQRKGRGAGRVRVKAGAQPLARWAFRLCLPWGQRGSVGRQHMARLWQGRRWQEQDPSGLKTQAQHGCPPTCSRCAPTPRRPVGWSCEYGRGGEEARRGEAGRRGKGGLLGPDGPHALPEVQPRALDPGSWIPWSHSWSLALSLQPGTVEAREAPSSWGKGAGTEGKRVQERNPLQRTGVGGQGREQRSPHPEERCVVG